MTVIFSASPSILAMTVEEKAACTTMSKQSMKLRTNLIWIVPIALASILSVMYLNKSAVQMPGEELVSDVTAEQPTTKGVVTTPLVGLTTPQAVDGAYPKSTANTTVEWRPGDKAQADELKRWKAERGWYDMMSEDLNGAPDYRTYSKDVLEKLGEQGDLRALHTLARLPISPAERSEVLTKAAVYGSTFALFQIANGIANARDFVPNANDESKRLAIVDALAHVEVVKIRGEIVSADDQEKEIQDFYQFSPNDSEKQLIQQRAKEIYNNLEAQRKGLGLGEFDNSVPPVADAYNRFYKNNSVQ